MKTRQTILIGSCAIRQSLLMGVMAARAESVVDKRALTIEGAKKVIAGSGGRGQEEECARRRNCRGR